MKNLVKISVSAMIFILVSCKSEFQLLTHQGNTVDIAINNNSGIWVSQFDRDKVFQELISYSKDTVLQLNPNLFFKSPTSINKTNRRGEKTGLWITGNYKYFEINNFKNGVLHGKSISYLHGNESIECKYKKGKLDGKYERKLGDYAFKRITYKNGKVTKLEIISPKW